MNSLLYSKEIYKSLLDIMVKGESQYRSVYLFRYSVIKKF